MFIVFLAQKLHRSIAEIRQLDISEIATWMAYFQLYPPETAANYRAARLAFYASHQFKRGHPKWDALKAEFNPEPEADEVDEQLRLVSNLSAFGDMPDEVAKRFKE